MNGDSPTNRIPPAVSAAQAGWVGSGTRARRTDLRRPAVDGAAWFAGGLAAAGAAGVLASVAPLVVTLGVLLGVLLLLGLVLLRRAAPIVARRREAQVEVVPGPPEVTADPEPRERGELRAARGLFYVGMLTLGLPIYRLSSLGLTVSEVAFLAAFILCVFAVLRGAAVVVVPTWMIIAIGVFVFGASISSLRAQSPPLSALQVLHFIFVLMLWPWVGAMVIRTRRQLITVLGLWGFSAAIDGVGALAQIAGFHLPGSALYQAQSGSAGPQGRYTAFTPHPNDLGGTTGLALVPALIFATLRRQSRFPGWLRWLPVPFIAVALVVSGSISGMVGAVLALLVWLSSPAIRSSSRVAVAIGALCALAAISMASSRITSPVQRVTDVTKPGYGSAQHRISDAEAAWRRIKRDPLVGKGLDAQDTYVITVSQGETVPYQVHGMPFAAWYETGLFGLVGMIGLLCLMGAVGWRTVRRSPGHDGQMIAWGLLGVFAAFLVEVMTQPMVLQTYDWITLVMLIASSGVLRAQGAHDLSRLSDTAFVAARSASHGRLTIAR